MVNRFVHGAKKSLAGTTREEDVYTEEYFGMVEQTTSQGAHAMAGSIVRDL
jgi:hypothetical protein